MRRTGLVSPSPLDDGPSDEELRKSNALLRKALADLTEEHKRVCVEYAASLEVKERPGASVSEFDELYGIVKAMSTKLEECQRERDKLQLLLATSQQECAATASENVELRSLNDRLSHELSCLIHTRQSISRSAVSPSRSALNSAEYEVVQNMLDAIGGADRVYDSLKMLHVGSSSDRDAYELEQRALSALERSRLLNEKILHQ